MSLFDDASLVITPNGYKASKLYSIKPTSGAGDMTVVRATTATRVNSAGVIESVAINVPRLDYPPLGGCPSILVEPLRTNLILQSQDISSADWVKGNAPTITTNIAVAPDGTTTADGIKADDALTFKIISQTKIVTANSTVTSSVFVKKETSQTNFGGFAFIFTGGTTKILRLSVDAVLGIVQSIAGNTLTDTTNVEDYGTYWRISATTTDNGSNTSLQYVYYATASTNGTNFTQGVGSVRTVWGFQLEVASNATSYIPTVAATVTRTADEISKTGISSLIGQTEGTLYDEVNLSVRSEASLFRRILMISNGAETDSTYLRVTSGNIVQFVSFDGGVQTLIPSLSSISGNVKIAATYKTNEFKLYINGVLQGTDLLGSIPVTRSILRIGNSDALTSAHNLNDRIELATLFKTALTDAQCISLTT